MKNKIESIDQELNFRREVTSASKDYVGKRTEIAEEVKPEFGTVLEAQLVENNTVGAIISSLRHGEASDLTPDPNYDPTDDIPEDRLPWWESYVDAKSPQQVQHINEKIDREIENRRIIGSASLKVQFVTGMIAGGFDPINFIPIGGTAFKVGKVGKIAATAKSTAQAGLVSSMASEVILQSQQETRTAGESVMNIAAETMLAGIIGAGAGALLSKKQFSKAAKDFQTDINTTKSAYELNPETQQLELSVGAKQSPKELDEVYKLHVQEKLQEGKKPLTREEFELENQSLAKGLGAKALAKGINKINPILRLFNARSAKPKVVLQNLSTHNLVVGKNELGLANAQAVETDVKRWRAPLAQALLQNRQSFKNYKQRIKAEGSEKTIKNYAEFKSVVSKALRRGDSSIELSGTGRAIPEVDQAAKNWRTKVFDPLKNRAIEVGLLPEDVKVETAISYLTRLWLRKKVKAQSPELRKRLFEKLKLKELANLEKSNKFENLADIEGYLEDVVDDIIDNLSGVNRYGENMPYDIKITTRGPLKERTLTFMDDVEIEDFLENDIEMIGEVYTRIMGIDTSLKEKFGDVNLKPQLAEIDTDYQRLIKKAKTEKERISLEDERVSVKRDLTALKDLMRGNYGKLNDPDMWIVKAGRIARTANYVGKLGGVVVSSTVDLARVVMVHGYGRFLNKGLRNVITNTKGIKLNVKEAKQAGNLLDNVLNTMTATKAELLDPYQAGSTMGRLSDNLARGFSKINLLTFWNDGIKGFASVITQQRLIEESRKLLGGKIKKKERTYLAFLGIDEGNVESIVKQIDEFHGKEGNLIVANTDDWTDGTAVRLYRNALNLDVDRTIVTKTLGDVPLLMNTELGKTIGQFKSFAFAANQQVLIAGLQQADRAALEGVISAIALGSLVYYLKEKGAGREPSDDPRKWLVEGIDRSGMLGIIMEAHNIAEKVTRGKVGINRFAGGEIMSRYSSRNAIGSVLGPTFGFAQDFTQIIGAIATGEVKESDVKATRRMIPGQNLFYLQNLGNALEENVNLNLGEGE